MTPSIPLNVLLLVYPSNVGDVIAMQNQALKILAKNARIIPGITVDGLLPESAQFPDGHRKLEFTFVAGLEVNQAEVDAISCLADYMTVNSAGGAVTRRTKTAIDGLNEQLKRLHNKPSRPHLMDDRRTDGFAASFTHESDGHHLRIVATGGPVETLRRLKSPFLDLETHDKQPIRLASQPHTGSLVPSM